MSQNKPTVPGWVDLGRLAGIDTDDHSWRQRTACGDQPTEVFFPVGLPGRGQGYDYTAAAAICARCPVRHECLAAWLTYLTADLDRTSGTYVGGATPAERREIRRALAAHRRRSAA